MSLRSFALYRDLGGVANLIDVAFAGDEGDIGAKARDEFRALKRVAPLLWFMSLFSPSLRDSFTGYVWEENGRLVGNVSIYRSQEDKSCWLIGNVSVLPEFRRRGIARKLTEAAIEYARRRKGKLVYLDVRSNNQTALDLYTSLGMAQFDTLTEMVLKKGKGFIPGIYIDELKPVDSVDDWYKAYDLALEATPPEVQEVTPLREKDFEPNIWGILEQTAMLSMGQGPRTYAVEKDHRFEAFLKFEPFKVRPYHKVSVMVRPESRGKYENLLASRTVHIAREYPRQNVLAELRTSEKEQIEAFQQHGFEKLRQLLRLGLKL